ncbi:MAG TPA: hypothetical protein P5121_15955, partial [Caldilineaceae bacterium]|nr:hypothetical protein [Caldilineaceae bacterium]
AALRAGGEAGRRGVWRILELVCVVGWYSRLISQYAYTSSITMNMERGFFRVRLILPERPMSFAHFDGVAVAYNTRPIRIPCSLLY